MKNEMIHAALVEVLQTIQAASDLECPPLNSTMKPLEELPKFDSKIWPVAVGMLSAKLGIFIANDVNVFRQDCASSALTIEEIVVKVAALAETQASSIIEPDQASAS